MQDQLNFRVFGGRKRQDGSSLNITQNREFVWIGWRGHKLLGSVWNFTTFARLPFGKISAETLKLGWVAFHSLAF